MRASKIDVLGFCHCKIINSTLDIIELQKYYFFIGSLVAGNFFDFDLKRSLDVWLIFVIEV